VFRESIHLKIPVIVWIVQQEKNLPRGQATQHLPQMMPLRLTATIALLVNTPMLDLELAQTVP